MVGVAISSPQMRLETVERSNLLLISILLFVLRAGGMMLA